MEGADEVLAAGKVDAGLAPHRGVHLGEQSGRYLHEVDPALVASGRKPGDVANDSPAERNDDAVARNPMCNQSVLNGGKGVECLVSLAVRDDVSACSGRVRQGRTETVEVERRHRLVGDHEGVATTDVRGEEPTIADDAGPDVDRVTPFSEVDLDGSAHSASMR